jgi:transcriptional regulator with XRE-family HTH domain
LTINPKEIDKYVGARVRARRLMVRMSQETLGEHLGLTFQQIQKYEKGTNRISAGRLAQIAEIFGESLSFFFPNQTTAPSPDSAAIDGFFATSDGVALARAAMKLPANLRRSIIHLCETVQ